MVAWGALYEARRVVLERIDLPGGGPRVLIAQISDVDFGGLGVRERQVERILEEAQPDLVAVTGDLVEFRGGRGERHLEGAIRFLDRLPAAQGIYWVVGESERHHIQRIRQALEHSRVRLLVNEEVVLRMKSRNIRIYGMGPGHARFEPARLGDRVAVRARSAGRFSPLVDATPGADMRRDYDMTGVLRFGDPDDFVGVMAYVPPGGEGGYSLLRHRDSRGFHLRRLGPGGGALGPEGPRFEPGTALQYRVRVTTGPSSNLISARLWPDGAAEPETWDLQAEDDSPGRPSGGATGICVKGGADDRLFSAWRVTAVDDGAPRGGRTLEGFDPNDGTWLSRSALRDWTREEGGPALRLLLAHNPDVALDLEAQGAGPVDLILSGHTQGGQIRLPWIGALYTGTELGRQYAAGLVRPAGRTVYVNRGLGTSFVPFRFLCPPEVTLLSIPLGGASS